MVLRESLSRPKPLQQFVITSPTEPKYQRVDD